MKRQTNPFMRRWAACERVVPTQISACHRSWDHRSFSIYLTKCSCKSRYRSMDSCAAETSVTSPSHVVSPRVCVHTFGSCVVCTKSPSSTPYISLNCNKMPTLSLLLSSSMLSTLELSNLCVALERLPNCLNCFIYD